MSKTNAQAPLTVEGGPIVVEFANNDANDRQPRFKKAKTEPRENREKQDLLTAKQFVEKYRREAVTASWDPSVLRKCGRGAEEILISLGAEKRKEKVPMRELERRRQLMKDKEELEGTRFMDLNRKKPKKKKTKKGKK